MDKAESRLEFVDQQAAPDLYVHISSAKMRLKLVRSEELFLSMIWEWYHLTGQDGQKQTGHRNLAIGKDGAPL